MDYICKTKALYDPKNPFASHPHWPHGLTHILYGLNADLIMLGLTMHEPHFLLLREKMSMLDYMQDELKLLEL